MEFHIQKLAEKNYKEFVKLAQATYVNTYSNSLSSAEIDLRISKTYSETTLISECHNPQNMFYTASISNTMVGYLHLKEHISLNALVLERIYISESNQGEGIGKALLEKAIEVAKNKGKSIIQLKCFCENLSALNFYKKQGFEIVDQEEFEILPGLKRFDHILELRFLGK